MRVTNKNIFLPRLKRSLQAIPHESKVVLSYAIQTSLELYKVMIPLLILTRILEQTGIIILLGNLRKPLMGVVDLPGNMGLVWATSLIVGTPVVYVIALIILKNLIQSVPQKMFQRYFFRQLVWLGEDIVL